MSPSNVEGFAMFEKLRPDPTFHPSPRLAMEAEREHIGYTALLSPDASRPDALAVVDLDPGSKTYGSVLHRLDKCLIVATSSTTSAGTRAVQHFHRCRGTRS
jgi:56kDa selenium binding protein (SBP56)